jgi:uncharacterized protein (TIGR02246 family)
MNKAIVFAAVVWAGMAHGLDMSVGAGIDASRKNLEAESEIRQRYEEFVVAFNKHDTTAMGAMWTRQGDHYEPDGQFAEGREAVQQLFQQEHASAFKGASIDLTIDTVWMISPTVALVNGFYKVNGVRDPKGNEIAIRKGHLTSVMLKEDGKWWVAASRATIPVPVPWRQPPPQ